LASRQALTSNTGFLLKQSDYSLELNFYAWLLIRDTTFINFHAIEISSSQSNCIMETFMEVLETSKKLWKQSPVSSCSTAFLIHPKFHLCLYNSLFINTSHVLHFLCNCIYTSLLFGGKRRCMSVSLQNTLKVLTNVTWNGTLNSLFFMTLNILI